MSTIIKVIFDLILIWLLYLPSEWSETGRDHVFTFVCVSVCAHSVPLVQMGGMTYCIRLMHEKLRIFPYGQYIVGNVVILAFWRYSQVQDQSGGGGEMYKNVNTISNGFSAHATACRHATRHFKMEDRPPAWVIYHWLLILRNTIKLISHIYCIDCSSDWYRKHMKE